MQLVRALKEKSEGIYPFHMPGHKRMLAGDGIFSDIYSIDVTETEGFDDLHEASGILKEAQDKAAELYGADETHFLVNGSTGGILAAICGTVTINDTVVVAANCHRSVWNAVALSHADIYVTAPEAEESFGICAGVDPASVKSALSDISREGTAVVITSPTYEGVVSDIAAIADICHSYKAVLIVDCAHGAHFGFDDDLPESPVKIGADVVISGVHKTMPSMTQTALIHINRNCPSKDRIRKMLTVFTTSSPSYVLTSSIDSMISLIGRSRKELFEPYVNRLNRFYEKASGLKCLTVLNRRMLTRKGSYDHDKGKIVVGDTTGRVSGRRLFDILYEEYSICAEMAGFSYVILMTSVADTDEGFNKVLDALFEIDSMICRMPENGEKIAPVPLPHLGEGRIKNRMIEAIFAEDTEQVAVERSCGRIAKDLITIYPPGIPVTLPGQPVSAGAAQSISEALRHRLKITGLNNKEVTVLWERSST